ncbi:MAG: precorrin-3B C(17)-methyltransferase [Synergistaceae bacterium]|nr:precorrin-3B C(17)-methyltransferase [Synergistaceae bacterium]
MIYVVGIGPGSPEEITPEALSIMQSCDIIAGYTKYIDLVRDLVPGKILFSSGMGQELDRCNMALLFVREFGKSVALISSGDAGVYGMAGLMLEAAAGSGVDVEIVPGITAATSCAAILGAPLMNDYATISLSDYLTEWGTIERRLKAACSGDFVICIYNPSSSKRPEHFRRACDIVLKYYPPETPAGYVRNAGREGSSHEIMTLAKIRECPKIDMLCTVIIGNSKTYILDGKMITRRGYRL